MRDRCLQAITNAGVADELAQQLVELVAEPRPGTFEATELVDADDVRICLLTALVAATRHWEFGEALKLLVQFVAENREHLSAYDQSRFWHIKGFTSWRLDGSVYAASQLFQRSIRKIQESDTPAAKSYLPRVLDAFGQLLHHNGQLQDARFEFELAAKFRAALNDEPGLALTLGNLGRLCIDVGDFAAAHEYLANDLEIVERISPELTQLRTQLLSQLATCAFQLGRLDEAKRFLDESERLAQSDENVVGLIFVALGRTQIALSENDLPQASELANYVLSHLSDSRIPDSLRTGIEALGLQFSAEVELARDNTEASLQRFAASREKFALVPNVSPVFVAAMLKGYAKATQAIGDFERSTLLLREALQSLDSTAADHLRASIEDELRVRFRDSWLLHSAGRFIGQEHIEFLLHEAGRAGFRGTQKHVAVLFSDIRGFTTISEHFSPESLIVFLNDFLSCMTRCVRHYDGMVDKFIGDALMALFGLPHAKSTDAENSMLTAIAMQAELVRFNRQMPAETPSLEIGIGIHFGSTVAGLIGSPQKRSYTVIGDTVNTASRLEGMTKQLGAAILVSDELVQQLHNPDRFLLRPLGKYCPKGRENAVVVYDLMGEQETSEYGDDLRMEIEGVRAALDLFAQREFGRARSAFQDLAQSSEQTQRKQGYELLSEASREYAEHAPADAWDGAIPMNIK